MDDVPLNTVGRANSATLIIRMGCHHCANQPPVNPGSRINDLEQIELDPAAPTAINVVLCRARDQFTVH